MKTKKKKSNKIFKNKKGAISDILSSAGQLVSNITDILPKPVLFLIFLFLLASLGYVISLAFNAFGIYCNTAGEPVKLNENLLSGLSLIGDIPELTEIGAEAVEANSHACRTQLSAGDGSFYNPLTNTTTNITGNKYYYEGTYCSICTVGILKSDSITLEGQELCISSATAIPDADKTWWQNVVCTSESDIFGSCQPPTGYYFDQISGVYVCNSDSCTGQTIGSAWDEKLSSKGAKIMYPSGTSNEFVGITCTEIKPKLAVFGIDILTFEIWLFITILTIIFLMWKHLT